VEQTTPDRGGCVGRAAHSAIVAEVNGGATAVAQAIATAFSGVVGRLHCLNTANTDNSAAILAAADAYAAAIATDIKTVTTSYFNQLHVNSSNTMQYCCAPAPHTQLAQTTARAVACSLVQMFAAVYTYIPAVDDYGEQGIPPPDAYVPYAGACASTYAIAGLNENSGSNTLAPTECKPCCPPDCLTLKYACGGTSVACIDPFNTELTATMPAPGNIDFDSDNSSKPFPGRPASCVSTGLPLYRAWEMYGYGAFYAPENGLYRFKVEFVNGAQFNLNLLNDCGGDIPLVSNPILSDQTSENGIDSDSEQLLLGSAVYTFNFKFFDCKGGRAMIRFLWKKPGDTVYSLVPIMCSQTPTAAAFFP
jgi:hypothetical protein